MFLLWQTCSTHVHLYFSHCLHVFTAWMFMYSLHVFSAYNHQHNIMCIVYDNRTTVVPWSVSMNCFHASIQAHTHHHVHILLHTILSLFLFKIVVTYACILSPLLACIHCILVHVFTPCFQCIQSPTYVHRIRQPIDWSSMNCFHELCPCKYACAYSSSCAHTIAHYICVVFVINCSTHVHV